MKAKELEDLRRKYKESMDELETLRTKVSLARTPLSAPADLKPSLVFKRPPGLSLMNSGSPLENRVRRSSRVALSHVQHTEISRVRGVHIAVLEASPAIFAEYVLNKTPRLP